MVSMKTANDAAIFFAAVVAGQHAPCLLYPLKDTVTAVQGIARDVKYTEQALSIFTRPGNYR